MSITPEQLADRKNHLGSSDLSSLFNLNRFQNKYDLWLRKTQDFVEINEEENEAIEIGNDMEPMLIAWVGRKLKKKIITDPDKLEFICPDDNLFISHIDGLVIDDDKPLPDAGIEAKSSSLHQEFGEPGTDEVPERTIIQCAVHFLCNPALKIIYVPAYIFDFTQKRALYVVERNEEIIAIIKSEGRKFRDEHMLTGIPPENTAPPSLELIKRIQRTPETWAEVDETLVLTWQTEQDARLVAEKAEKIALAALLAAVGTAEGARTSWGVFTYYEQKGADSIDRAILKEKYPEIYTEVSSPVTFRKTGFKKNKGA